MAALIDAIERVIADSGQAGAHELEWAVAQALGGPGLFIGSECLKPRVHRLAFELGGGMRRSYVVKRMHAGEARRNELAINRWLPELGLGDAAPALLGVAAERAGRYVWHVYDDLGPWMLDAREPDRARVAAAVRVIASLHTRFAAHPLLAEIRFQGETLGHSFFAASVRDAIHGLERLRPPIVDPTPEQAALRDRLLGRLRRLADEEPARARALAQWGGPETFLHGDLWTTNAFVEPLAAGHRVRLIDWDHAGVGPASYDLSTFLLRFAPQHRSWILALYRDAAADGPWRIPGVNELNLLFETAEAARYASRAAWPAIALLRERAAWGFAELAAVDQWFEALGPILPASG